MDDTFFHDLATLPLNSLLMERSALIHEPPGEREAKRKLLDAEIALREAAGETIRHGIEMQKRGVRRYAIGEAPGHRKEAA